MPPPPLNPRAARKDGEDSRERLLLAGLRLFAHQGYAKTSTRELAEAASVNIAAISYYFGDKAGLYRAVCFEPMGTPEESVARFAGESMALDAALAAYYEEFLAPLRQGDLAQLCMKLHFREMLEPTGLWDHGVEQGIRPVHEALLQLLQRHLDVAEADADLRRLAICIAGLGVHLHVGKEVIDHLEPELNEATDAIDRWSDYLVNASIAMIDAERRRRRRALGTPRKRGKT